MKLLFTAFALIVFLPLNSLNAQSSNTENQDLNIVFLNNELFSEIISNKGNKKIENNYNISFFTSKTTLTLVLNDNLKDNLSYCIFTSVGQIVSNGKLISELSNIDASDFSPGIYYFSIFENSELVKTHTFSIVK